MADNKCVVLNGITTRPNPTFGESCDISKLAISLIIVCHLPCVDLYICTYNCSSWSVLHFLFYSNILFSSGMVLYSLYTYQCATSCVYTVAYHSHSLYVHMYRFYVRIYVCMYIVCMQNHQGVGPEGGT